MLMSKFAKLCFKRDNPFPKKDRGDVSAIVFILIGMVCLLIVTALGMSYLHASEKSSQAELIMHSYMLEIEGQGGITPDIQSRLIADLEAMGIVDTTVTATPAPADSNYGETINLEVTGTLNSKIFTIAGVKDGTFNIRYTKIGTSKKL